ACQPRWVTTSSAAACSTSLTYIDSAPRSDRIRSRTGPRATTAATRTDGDLRPADGRAGGRLGAGGAAVGVPGGVGGVRLPRGGEHVPRLLRLVPGARHRADGAGEPGATGAARAHDRLGGAAA